MIILSVMVLMDTDEYQDIVSMVSSLPVLILAPFSVEPIGPTAKSVNPMQFVSPIRLPFVLT